MKGRLLLGCGSVIAAALTVFGAAAVAADDIKREYVPGRENAIPHVSGDRKFSDTFEKWKDPAAIMAAKKAGLKSHEVNFKDFRWMEKSLDGEFALEEGRKLFNEANDKGQSCASCHGQDGEKLKGVHATSPKVNPRTGKVTVIPTQIRTCAEERLGRTDLHEETRGNTMLAYWIGYLSDGQEINVDVATPGPLKDSYERGRDLYFRRVGNFHFACASCHTPPTAGNYLRGQRPTTFFGDASQYPIYHFPYQLEGHNRGYVFTLQHQIKSCQMLSRMYQGKEGSPSMTDIETFLMASSNGYKVSIPTSEYNMNTDYLGRE